MPLINITFEARNRCTERKQTQDQVSQLVFYNPLTKLPNRHQFNDHLSQSVAASMCKGCFGALICLDLENFKPINDTHGHIAVELRLAEVVKQLKICVREVDTIVCYRGDEFIVELSELTTDNAKCFKQDHVAAETLRATLSKPVQLIENHDGKASAYIRYSRTASIGSALFLGRKSALMTIFKHADVSMCKVKESGHNAIRFYQPAEHAIQVAF